MIDVVYMAGAGRSGSTLLERILGQLDGCVAVGELRHLWAEDPAESRCGCGRVIAECPFWRDVLARVGEQPDLAHFEALAQAKDRVDRMRHIPAMLTGPRDGTRYRHDYVAYTDKLRCLYAAIRERTDARIILDSSKDISTLYLLTTMEDVRVRILHVVRDSRAVAHSWTRAKRRPHVVGREAYMATYSPRRSALDWMYRNMLSEQARGRAGGYLRLRYEDLVANPSTSVERVARFMGLEDTGQNLIHEGTIEFTRENHTVAGNPMRFERAVTVRLDSAWQQELPAPQKALVTALTWPLLRRYNYL